MVNPALTCPLVEYLSRKIEEAWREQGFVGILIYGVQSVGKTQLALSIAAKVHKSWRAALDSLCFTLKELYDILEGERKKVIVWDDAGAWGGRYTPLRDRELAAFVAETVQVIRTQTASLILTMPSISDVMKPIRDQPDWLRAELRKGPRQVYGAKLYRTAVATVYTVRIDPLGRPWPKTIVERAVFPLAVPAKVYREYLARRNKYTAIVKARYRTAVEERGTVELTDS